MGRWVSHWPMVVTVDLFGFLISSAKIIATAATLSFLAMIFENNRR